MFVNGQTKIRQQDKYIILDIFFLHKSGRLLKDLFENHGRIGEKCAPVR